jgi:hypothetical protein
MVPSVFNFKWPSKENLIVYNMGNVIRKLHSPHVTSAIGVLGEVVKPFRYSET